MSKLSDAIALMITAMYDHTQIVELLLADGSDEPPHKGYLDRANFIRNYNQQGGKII